MSSAPPPPPPDPAGEPEPPYVAPQPSFEHEVRPPSGPPELAPPKGSDQDNRYGGAPDGGLTTPLSEPEERIWSVLAHLSGPVAALVSVGLLNFLGPLVIWAIFKNRSPRVRTAAAGSFNFNVTLWIVYALLLAISVASLGLLLLITIPVGIAVWVVSIVLHVMAAIKASNGEVYAYPGQIPVLK